MISNHKNMLFETIKIQVSSISVSRNTTLAKLVFIPTRNRLFVPHNAVLVWKMILMLQQIYIHTHIRTHTKNAIFLLKTFTLVGAINPVCATSRNARPFSFVHFIQIERFHIVFQKLEKAPCAKSDPDYIKMLQVFQISNFFLFTSTHYFIQLFF